ncbi:MAG: formylglycine-generating enzyme family protein [Bacteroidia bacterium]|nr:formylglycine-generating enzyme family protein [Bacteroidia bacterium]
MNRITRISMLAVFAIALLLPACDSDDGTTTPDPQPNTIERSGSLVRITAKGKNFSMGSVSGNADERPVHTVSFTRDFWMDSTEVTQGEYERIMKARYPAYLTPAWSAVYGLGTAYPAYLTEWGDAVLFCNARSLEAGLDPVYTYTAILGTPGNGCTLEGVTADLSRNGFRLPTEAEWEYACRGGNASDFSWGRNLASYPASPADSTEFGSYSVWAGNSWNLSSDSPDFGTRRVASRKANAYGLHDMHGNLWEWCHDWYDETYYAGSPGTDPSGPTAGNWHALRGGSWGNDAAYLRASNRSFSTPDYLFNFIGFRTVRNAQ